MWRRKKAAFQRSRPNDALRTNKQAVYSYYNTVPQAQQRTALSEKIINLADQPKHVRRLPTIIACCVIGISFLISLTVSSTPSVGLAESNQPSPYRDLQEYAQVAEEILSSKLAYRTKLSINTKEVEQALMERFPELNGAVLRLPVLGRRPNLVVSISKPALLLAAQTKSYVLDEYGVAVSEAADVSEQTRRDLLVVRDESGLEITKGKQAVTSKTVAFIRNVIAQLKAESLEVNQITLPQSANQLDIKLKGVPYSIKTDVAGDARLQIGSYLAVKKYLAKQGITPRDYVDVRVEEKVFYK